MCQLCRKHWDLKAHKDTVAAFEQSVNGGDGGWWENLRANVY